MVQPQSEELRLMTFLREISAQRNGKLQMSSQLHEDIESYMNPDWNMPHDFRRKLKIGLFKKLLAENMFG